MEEASPTPPEPVIMKEQEEQIIRACCEYQFLTILDMAMLLNLPKSLNYVRRIAASLAGNDDEVPGHYLYRFALPQRAGGNALRVFVPGEASRTLWRQDEGDGFFFKDPSTTKRYSYSFLYHNLAVSRVCLCAMLFCRDPAYYLVETRLAYDMSCKPPRVSLGADSQQTTTPVIPDAWLFIERVADGQGTALWFEVDNATTYRQSFHRRLSARLGLITSKAYSEYFGTDAVLVCYAVLGNEARMHTLRQWTWELLVREKRTQFAPLFRFASVEYETLYEQIQTLILQPVWFFPGDRSQENPPQVALLSPPQDKEKPHATSLLTVAW
jgi:hypothetical protein